MRKSTTTAANEDLDEDSLVFRNVTWDFYDMFIDSLGERPTRVSFDGRTLEMAMTLSFEHEGLKAFLGAVVNEVARVRRADVVRGGSTTLKYKRIKKGLEPDQCYWIANAAAMRGAKRIDMKIHPAPDLVIEIDVTHATVNREAIYLAMGVGEMWHYARSSGLTAWANRENEWQRVQQSVSFPGLRLSELGKFVARYVGGESETLILTDLAAWLTAKQDKRKSK